MDLAGLPRELYDPSAMARLNRYILRQCFGVMIFVTAALSAAIWLAQSLRLIDLIVNRGLSIDVFLYLAALILPRFLDIVLPIGVFIAVLFTFNRLTAESELVVMRSSGLSHVALAKPVLMLAGIAFLVLMSLSVYFLPASNRAFKDLQFEIRNRFVLSLIQEGTFTTISDKLTIYVRSRDDRGEVTGLLINDSRNPQRYVTIVAERGAFVDSPAGSRIVMVNGNRQQFDTETRKLSLLTFESYTLDLDTLHDAPVVRFREPQERFMDELFFPPKDVDGSLRQGFVVEAHQRILVPLFSDPACLSLAWRAQSSRTAEACPSRDRPRIPVRTGGPRRQQHCFSFRRGDPADVCGRPLTVGSRVWDSAAWGNKARFPPAHTSSSAGTLRTRPHRRGCRCSSRKLSPPTLPGSFLLGSVVCSRRWSSSRFCSTTLSSSAAAAPSCKPHCC